MKKLILVILFLFSINTFSQKLNGFKFVYVAPIQYKNGSQDYWGIEAQTKRFFGKLGYEILNTINERNSIKNKCEILDIAIGHTSILPPQYGYNTVNFNLYDCNGSFTTFSDRAKTFSAQGDYSKATRKALKWFLEKKLKKYSFDSSFTPILKVAKVKQNTDLNFLDEQSIRDYLLKKELDPIEGIWQYASNDVVDNEYKLLILKEEFKYNLYIIEGSGLWNPSDKKAEFETAASEKVITIKWTMGDKKTILKGIGEVKNNAIIEFTLPNNNKISLYKVYPKFDSNSKRKTSKNGEWAGNGSGVIISKSGHIITNHHVIKDAEKIEIEFMLDGELQKFNAEVVQVDKTNDLAVLKIFDMNFDGVSEPPYNFKFRGSDVGTKVYAFGYPMALSIMGKEIKVTDGMISSKSGFDGNITTYQITAPIQGGNSGGPLFDEQANLIGINSSGIRKDIADNVAYSIKTSYVSNLLDVLPKSIELPSSTKLKSLPLTEQIKEISKYVVLVKVK
jgi:S1-C subfamily serine protease